MTNPLAAEMRRALDPVALARAIGMECDAWQAEVLRSGHPRILLNCARQSGKSTVAAVLAVHAAVYEPGSLVLLVSRALRQSGELFRTCTTLYRAIGRPVVTEAENALSLTLGNGSRIISLPSQSDAWRGYSAVRLLVVDEAARVADALIDALFPMLAVSRGRIIALSTPAGLRGWWWDAWANGGENWLRVMITAPECARIPREYLDAERERLQHDMRTFLQEYMCEFAEPTDQAFETAAIDRAFSRELEPLRFDLPEA